MRQRTIFVGVREDLGLEPVHPKPLAYRYSVRDALPWIVAHEQKNRATSETQRRDLAKEPCHTIRATAGGCGDSMADPYLIETKTEKRKFTIDEVKAICSFPPDFVLCGSYAQQWERLGNSVPPVMMKAIAETIRDGVLMK